MRRSVVATLGAVLMACDGNTYVPPPPPEVTVAQPQEREVTTYNEFSGHTASVEAVDIRARVQGFLKSMHFSPGTEVNKGDLLFVIEPDLYRARVEQAEADLAGGQGAGAGGRGAARDHQDHLRAAGGQPDRPRAEDCRRAIRRERGSHRRRRRSRPRSSTCRTRTSTRRSAGASTATSSTSATWSALARRRCWRPSSATIPSTPTSTRASASCSSTAISTGAVRRRRRRASATGLT